MDNDDQASDRGVLGWLKKAIRGALGASPPVSKKPSTITSSVISKRGVQSERALDQTKKLLEADPANTELQEWYAFQLYCNERYEEAILLYEPLLDQEPPKAEHIYYLANSLYALGNEERALDLWQKLLQRFPEKGITNKAQRKIERIRAKAAGLQ